MRLGLRAVTCCVLACSACGGSVSRSSGSGGGGGEGGPCADIDLVQPVLTVQGETGTDDDYAQLTFSSDDEQRVSVVFGRKYGDSVPVVHHVSLVPWQDWPAADALGPVHTTLVSSAIWAPSRASNSRFAFAAWLNEEPAFVAPVDPNSDGVGPNGAIALAGTQPMQTVARAPGLGPPTHLALAYGSDTILAQVVTEDGTTENAVTLVCGGGGSTAPLTARAVAYADGWLVAATAAAPFGSCATMAGAPDRVEITFIAPDGAADLRASIPSDVVGLQAAAHPDGAFVAWALSDRILAVRYDAKHGSIEGPTELAALVGFENSWTIASTGNRLFFAYKNQPVSTSPLAVSFLDAALTPLMTATFDPGTFDGASSAIGSPTGSSALIAWKDIASQPWQLRIARFDCVP